MAKKVAFWPAELRSLGESAAEVERLVIELDYTKSKVSPLSILMCEL